MTNQIEPFFTRSTTRIRRIDATIFGNNEVIAYSVCKDKDDSISRPELYEGGAFPKQSGLVDSRLGAVTRNAICGHCGLTSSTYDPGHFGHSLFTRAKFHIGLMPFVKSLLSVVCIRCSKPYIQKHAPEMVAQLKSKKNSRSRLAANKKLCKGIKNCPNCSIPVPKITTPKGAGARTTGSIEIIAEYKGVSGDDTAIDGKKKVTKILTADRCYEIFNNIDKDDCVLLGLDPIGRNRPEDCIIKVLPFPPNTIRPSVHMEGASDSSREDQMTHKLSDILKANAKETRTRNDTDTEINKAPDLAQFHYATYLDNGSVAMPRSEQKGAPTKSIRDRIRAKTGRVRYNLMGKRVNFSGRSVITPDSAIRVSELGVPLRVAMRLTYAIKVTKDNLEAMSERVRNGVSIHPGANFVVPVIDGIKQRPKFLKGLKREVVLNIGDIVHRHIENGDVVLFNRQPTLHRQSMMAHFAKVLSGQWASFRLNVSACHPYNADFDGDEMNIHVPQNEQCRVELLMLASVPRQLISPGKCKPLIGCVQDTALAGFLMTDERTLIDSRTAMNIMAHSGLPYSILHNIKPNKMYSGKYLLSMIIPKEINCTLPKGGGTVIVRGKIQEPGGNITKSAFGSAKNGILHQSWNEFYHQGTDTLLDRYNRITTAWMYRNGFSVGSKDIEVPEDIEDKISRVIATQLLEINNLITEAETSTILQEVAILEPIIQGKLDSVREIVGKTAVSALGKDNGFNIMESAESKGSLSNTAQMTACLGQQAIEGKRVIKRLYGRTLPHFYQNDDSGPARGFIVNNYRTGLTPAEFIIHMMTGREGMIDTAIKTAETGYIQRRLVKAMEDLMVNYDNTIRTAGGALLQPLYGYNGINPIYQAQLYIGMLLANDITLKKNYCFTDSEAKKYGFSTRENDEHYKMMLELRDTLRFVQQTVTRSPMIINETVTSPINFAQIIRKFRASGEDYPNEKVIDAKYVMNRINVLLMHESTPMMCISNKDLANADCIKLRDEDLAKTFLRIIIYEFLSPKKVLIEYGFGKERFDAVCEESMDRFTQAMAAAGEMVGSIGAQSTGEPTTQMVLQTFHAAGVSAKGIGNLGVPRMRELLGVSKNPKTPRMIVRLEEKYENNRDVAERVASAIKYTTMENITSYIENYYEPDPLVKGGWMEKDNATNLFHAGKCQSDVGGLPFLMRIVLSREGLLNTGMQMLDIKAVLCEFFGNRVKEAKKLKNKDEKAILDKITRIAILSNSSTSNELVIHVRYDATAVNFSSHVAFSRVILTRMKLKGVEGLTGAVDVIEDNYKTFDKNGEMVERNRYAIVTEGVNLLELRYFNCIDLQKTTTNNIVDIQMVMGIEAARASLKRELKTVIEGSGTDADYRHLCLLADLATNSGDLVPIDRHGMMKFDADFLAKASNETTVEQLLNSAFFGDQDNMNNVSSRIMTGMPFNGGGNMGKVFLDFDDIQRSEYLPEQSSTGRGFTALTENKAIDDILRQTAKNKD
jgi:DNA-directed RNA polymerase II subunit RPB1